MWEKAAIMAHMSRSEGNHKDPGRQTQVVIFSGKCVDLLGQLSVPPHSFVHGGACVCAG